MELNGLVRAYHTYQKMTRHPRLIEEMRKIFINALAQRGVITVEEIDRQARSWLERDKIEITGEKVQEYRNVLVDFYFARHFTPNEVENYINLARKNDRFRNLTRVVNWERATSTEIRAALKEFCDIPEGDVYISPSEAEGVRVALINYFISNQLGFIGIAKNHITIRDVDEMLDRAYWNPRRTGKIGGKAAGMLLAHKIILPRLTERDPELEKFVTIPDSYYFNAGIFSDFIDYNELHYFHSQKYKTREMIEEEYKTISQLFQKASFPPDTVEEFRAFLDEVDEHPLILRSSSLLEDNVGYAFSGKYDSVFLANQGDLETRLEEFIWGLKRVHMSTFGPSPILYRLDHNLLDFDEKMSVLVQKVVGRRVGDYFFPFVAGVAFSHNAYIWNPQIKKEEGLVRLVFGLGTRAVDRVGQDYPRMIPLSHPLLRPEIGAERITKYSQKMMDVINLKSRRLETISYLDLLRQVGHPDLFYAVSVNQDGHLAAPLFKGQAIDLNRSCLTFENFLTKTPFVALIKKILRKLEDAYGRPVDVEFAWDNGKFYLLQCRALAFRPDVGNVSLPENVPREQILFTNDQGVASAVIKDVEYVVYVDPKAYGRLGTYEEKLAIAAVVSKINRFLETKRYALFGPGRWGSNDINLGVRVGYGDINRCLILGEIAFEAGGSRPEVSYGTHFFNDLVEAQIVPVAIYPDQAGTLFREEFFLTTPNEIHKVSPDLARYASVVHVIHVPSVTGGRLFHVYQDGQKQEGIGFFARFDGQIDGHTSGGQDESGGLRG
jgi:pyruvate, water dikinase